MEILGFIPARGASKGIPRKNIYPLDGKPLIAHTIEQSIKSKITRVFVSTDSEEIAAVSQQYGVEVPFLRSKELACDNSIIEDAMIEAFEKLKQAENYYPDIVVLLHPTTPLRTAKHIDECIDILKEKRADAVMSVSEPMQHPGDMVWWNEKEELHFLLESIAGPGAFPGKIQRQDFPTYWFINGAVYVFTYRSLVETGNRYGRKTVPYIMSQLDSIDIDSLDSLRIVEALLMRRRNLKA